ncbi:YggT family protein [Salimicrobium flavidum]|uniref:YggT family protein n=1 Tax=Salimicrobium flavidum TaxID=570947 RepID=A0A1N7ILD4_9BACI|nr:YggT family protein [Salimicrobium flavidum]SIS37898.1 YggT family protein [Salimicrobium flavidum]
MDLIFSLLINAIQIYSWLLIIYILMSWFPGARDSSFGQGLAKVTEPFLEPFRKIIPPLGMIDISPIVAILTLNFASRGIQQLYFMLM